MSRLVTCDYEEATDYRALLERYQSQGCKLLTVSTSLELPAKQYIWKKEGYSKLETEATTKLTLIFECPFRNSESP